MLKRLVKFLLPNKGDVVFSLFAQELQNAYCAAKLLLKMLRKYDEIEVHKLGKLYKNQANRFNRDVIKILDQMFITPIDRGMIQELSGYFNKLTKKIVRIIFKLNVYKIDIEVNNCLIKTSDTLLNMVFILSQCISALQDGDIYELEELIKKINELEEVEIEVFRDAMDDIYSGKFEVLTSIKLKEIYHNIDSVIDLCVTSSELVLKVALDTI